MTTFQTQQRIPRIGLAVSEDPMEVTTDMDPHLEAGNDIDIDLDLTGDVQQDEEDEYMVENDEDIIDADLVSEGNSTTADDDEMADGGYVEGSIAGRSSVHDEDIEVADYVEPERDEDAYGDVVVETDLPDNEEQVDASEPKGSKNDHQTFDATKYGGDHYYEQSGKYESERDATLGTSPNRHKEASSIDHYIPKLVNNEATREEDEEHSSNQQSDSETNHDEPELAVRELSREQNDEYRNKHVESRLPETNMIVDTGSCNPDPATYLGDEQEEIAAATEEQLAPSSKLESETHLEHEPVTADGFFLVKSINVHPVVVVYQDSEISLFPPIDQEADEEEEEEQHSSTYFLQDEQLASGSIQNLLGHLRSVLGESIGEEDELTIDIVELGLRISEFSTNCSTTSLSDIIDIYIHLQHYDGLDSPPPLHMNLTTIARFPHRLESLLLAIAEKRGLSQTRSSYVIEERQQCEAEETSSRDVEEALVQNDMTLGQKVESSVPLQDENTPDTHRDETTKKNSVSSPSSSSQPKSLLPPLQAAEEASGDDFSREKVATVADGQPSDDSQTSSTDPSPLLALPIESKRHVLEESTLEDDDFIDYEDDNELAQGNTSSSSTLQGDTFDGTGGENTSDSDKDILKRGTAKVQVNGSTPKASVGEKGAIRDTSYNGHDDCITKTGDMERPDPGESDRDHLKHSNEEKNVASCNAHSGKEMISIDSEQPRQPQDDNIQPTGRTKYNQDKELGQPKDEAVLLQADVTQEQQICVNDNENDLERTLLEDEQRHGDQSTTIRPDYQTIRDMVYKDGYQGAIDDGRESTKLGETAITSIVQNGEVVDNPAPIENTEARLLLDGTNQPQDDNDEITYEDDVPKKHSPTTYEDEIADKQTLTESITAGHNNVPSPESLKRARSLHEGDDGIESDLQGAKRMRSD